MQLSPTFKWDKAFIRKLLLVAVPIMVQNLVAASLHIVDGVMIGQLGDAPYAAVTQANRFTFVFQLFLFGTCSGCGILFSQYWGRRDVSGIHRVMGLALGITLCLAAVFAGLGIFGTKLVVGLFLPAGSSFDYAASYLRIVSIGYIVQAVDNVYAAAMKSSEQTRIPMIAAVCAIACNTLLNWVLIFGRLGLPAMGVQGAAIATVVSATLSLCINVTASYGKKLASAFDIRQWRMPDKKYLLMFFPLVLPVVINEGLWSMGTSMYGVFYGKLGDAAVSAVGIVNTVDNLVFVAIYGIMNATAILVGGTLGAGDRDMAWLTSKRMTFCSIALGVTMGIIQFAIKYPLLQVFKVSEQAREMANLMLLFSCFVIWVRSFNSVMIVGILRAGGDTVFSMLLDTCVLWLVGVPLVGLAALALKLPVWQVYMFTIVEEIIKMCISIPRFRSRKWMNVLTVSS